jgi:hypothetical protein
MEEGARPPPLITFTIASKVAVYAPAECAENTTEYISLQEMKQGQCICPLGWSVHCNFTGDGKCNERGWACTPHPHQPLMTECTPESRRYYSVYSVRHTNPVSSLVKICTLWQDLRAPEDTRVRTWHPSIIETLPDEFPDLKHEFGKLESQMFDRPRRTGTQPLTPVLPDAHDRYSCAAFESCGFGLVFLQNRTRNEYEKS